MILPSPSLLSNSRMNESMDSDDQEELQRAFGKFLYSGAELMAKGALLSVTTAEHMKDPSIIDRFRRSGFDIFTHGHHVHVLPALPFDDE